jgi:hypothetical protein
MFEARSRGSESAVASGAGERHMKFECQFVLEPYSRVRSPWFAWPRSSAGIAEVRVLQASGPCGIEMSVDRRIDDDASARHASVAVGPSPGTHQLFVASVDAPSVRVEFESRSEYPIPVEFSVQDRPMT